MPSLGSLPCGVGKVAKLERGTKFGRYLSHQTQQAEVGVQARIIEDQIQV